MQDAFLDIETTGLSATECEITVIGIYLANGTRNRLVQLVGNRVTDENLLNSLQGTNTIYTYNGMKFDLPFIQQRLGVDLTGMYKHCDLMYRCWDNNLFGGMKSVEVQLDIPRRYKEINGLEAIKLWWRYINNYDEKALSLLLEYNKEDVVNLKTLRDRLFKQ
ncbi:MAG: ribonuclease H-like domain-containing protein [Dehalococcoidales bacterium]|nr:ribonuclease H-like domain-containing protein [Dehalococcoidales bacterium]